MIKTECDIEEQFRAGVQVANLSKNDSLVILEQRGIQRTDGRYVGMFLCLQRDCGKCLVYFIQKNNEN